MHDEHRKIAEFYDRTYYANAAVPPATGHDRHLVDLASRMGVTPGMQVLDVACGTGEWLHVLADRGCVPHGTDISGKAIDVCRLRMPGGDFHTGAAETLPYPDDTFDLVTCLGSLEHFLDQPGALREMQRVSRPRARLLILVPNAGFPPYRLGLYRGTHQVAARETVRSLDEWEGMFSAAGLVVERKWKDLHVLNGRWLFRAPWSMVPLRLVQAAMLPLWPLSWQYQVYHRCRLASSDA
jgi:ubiquinone/menaquinone biosynthesis C-methylase UbiE